MEQATRAHNIVADIKELIKNACFWATAPKEPMRAMTYAFTKMEDFLLILLLARGSNNFCTLKSAIHPQFPSFRIFYPKWQDLTQKKT